MIGFYVHHHGTGHLRRTVAVASALAEPVAILTSLPVDASGCETALPPGSVVVSLPADEVDPGAGDATGSGALHWAPVGHPVLGRRMAGLVGWLTGGDAELLVVDVSVEVLVAARLCSVPTVAVRELGDRNDRAHRLGFDLASALLAPYPADFDLAVESTVEPGFTVDADADGDADREAGGVPSAPRRPLFHGGLYSRFSGRHLEPNEARSLLGIDPDENLVVVVMGGGGLDVDPMRLQEIERGLPNRRVVVLGEGGAWVEDVFPWLRAADVVIGHGGANTVAEVAAADVPFVCVPQRRPHGEQQCRANRLAALGAAVVVSPWPEQQGWAEAVTAASDLGSQRLRDWAADSSPTIVARWIRSVADSR